MDLNVLLVNSEREVLITTAISDSAHMPPYHPDLIFEIVEAFRNTNTYVQSNLDTDIIPQ